MKIEYHYAEDGWDSRGARLPDVPVLWLELVGPRGARFRGPCIIDTGFDAGLYSNEDLAGLLEGVTPSRQDRLQTVGREDIAGEVFSLRAFLVRPTGPRKLRNLGITEAFVPILPEHLSFEVLVGRELLNRLVLRLDGKKTVVP